MPAQARLLDQFGVEMDLTPAVAPVLQIDGVESTYRDRFRDYPSRNLTPMKLANILTQADSGDPFEWILLCEEILEKEPKFKSVLNTRALAVKGLYWEVEPCESDEYDTAIDKGFADEVARFCGKTLRATNFDELISNLLTALGKPHAVSGIDWRGRDRDGKAVPRFKTIPATHLRWAFMKDEIRLFDPHLGNMSGQDFGEALKPWSTVRALYNPDEDHPTRGGLLRTLCWYYLFKIITLKDLIASCERYGMPLRVVKLDDINFRDSEYRELIRQSIRTLGVDGSAVLSKNADLEITAAAKSGADIFMAVIDYVDKSAAQVVLGHELTSQSSAGAGQLGITAAREVRQDIVEGDCHWLSAIVERDVLKPLVGFNYGWDKIEYLPHLYFDFEPPSDLMMSAKVQQTIAATFPDLEFSEQQIREQYGIDPPVEDDPEDVLLPAKKAAPISAQQDQQPDGTPDEAAPPPGTSPDEPLPAPPARVNSRTLARKRHRRGPGKYRPSQQRKVDRLARRGVASGEAVLETWRKQLRTRIRKAVADGDVFAVRQAIVKAYPELDAADLEREIHDQTVLARLFGRNG